MAPPQYLVKTFEYDYIRLMFRLATQLAMTPARLPAAALCVWVMTLTSAVAAELVMIERAGCAWCARWDAEVAPAYEKTNEGRRAPLRRHNLDQGQPNGIVLERPVRYTPTFLLVDDGREVGRITGYIENGMFWGMLSQMIAKLPVAATSDLPVQPPANRETAK